MIFGSHWQLIYLERAESHCATTSHCVLGFFYLGTWEIRIYGLFFEGCNAVSSPEACFKHKSTNVLCAKAQLRNMRDEVKTRGGWQGPSSITWWLTAFLLTLNVYKWEQDVKKWVSAFLGQPLCSWGRVLESKPWGGTRVSITSFPCWTVGFRCLSGGIWAPSFRPGMTAKRSETKRIGTLWTQAVRKSLGNGFCLGSGRASWKEMEQWGISGKAVGMEVAEGSCVMSGEWRSKSVKGMKCKFISMQRQVGSGKHRWGFHGASVTGDAEEAASVRRGSGRAGAPAAPWFREYLAAALPDPGEQCSGWDFST